MKHLKRKRSHDRKMGQKAILALALFILLCSRVLSSVETINEVQASFPTEQMRAEIPVPVIESNDDTVTSHVEFQKLMSGEVDVPLQEITEKSKRAGRIRSFYERWNAPMALQAEYIVDAAQRYGIDWRLIPAISIVESSGGRYCFRPYNAFGWGKMGFNSYEEAIETVTHGLALKYGTDNPYAIAPRYNPVTPSAWASKVSGLMSQM